MTELTKSQIDRLGDRLREVTEGRYPEADIRLLEQYRLSFAGAFEKTVEVIRACGESPTGRAAKTTFSIVWKLRREKIRLSQMQDIAGCRIIVPDIIRQNQVVGLLSKTFAQATIIDRREKPSHGYRAVHLVIEDFGNPVEIQVRTSMQHLWAELSEKCSDLINPTLKYGVGDEQWLMTLADFSSLVKTFEGGEIVIHRLKDLTISYPPDAETLKALSDANNAISNSRERILGLFKERTESLKGMKDSK